jgi:D-3-phosphoglycerate dehydrogenase
LTTLAANVDAIMTNWADANRQVIAASGRCRIVARYGVGLDNIDVAYCSEHQIPVTNVPDYCLTEVAEHALASILTLGRKIGFYHLQTKQGIYDLQSGPVLRRIEGQTVGIVGFGNIGRRLAEKCLGTGMKVSAYSRSNSDPMPGVTMVSLQELLRESDYVSLHVPLTETTRHMFGLDEFRAMKRSAYLINTARGGIVNHEDLWAALTANEIAGAALDVQDPEPPDLNLPLYRDPRVVVTPHAAFYSQESLEQLRTRVATQVLVRLQGGIPEHVVNRSALDSPGG